MRRENRAERRLEKAELAKFCRALNLARAVQGLASAGHTQEENERVFMGPAGGVNKASPAFNLGEGAPEKQEWAAGGAMDAPPALFQQEGTWGIGL